MGIVLSRHDGRPICRSGYRKRPKNLSVCCQNHLYPSLRQSSFRNNSGALAPRDEPNAEGTVGRSSTQEALERPFLQNLATQGSQGQNVSINFNTFNAENMNFTSYNAPGSYIPVYSGDSNTHSQNLAPAESPSQVDLTTDVPRDHDNQEAPITTSVNFQPGTDPTPVVPDSHEDNPEVTINASQPYYAMIPEDPYSVNRWAEPTQREHQYLCVTCQQCFSSKREKHEHIKSYHTCRWCRGGGSLSHMQI